MPNIIGLAIILGFSIRFIWDKNQQSKHRCGSAAGLFNVHGCFHSDIKVTPSGAETSSKDKDAEESGSATELRGGTCTAPHPGVDVQAH